MKECLICGQELDSNKRRKYCPSCADKRTKAARCRWQQAYYQRTKETQRKKARDRQLQNRSARIAYAKKYYQANADKFRIQRRLYVKNNPEAAKQSDRQSYRKNWIFRRAAARKRRLENKAKLAEQNKSWRKQNRLRVSNLIRQYKARKKGALGYCSSAQIEGRFSYFGYQCRYCRIDLATTTASIDHMIPVSRGGTNWPSNLVPACLSCNASKKDRTYHEFLRWKEDMCLIPMN